MASIKGDNQQRPSHLFTWLRKEKREKKRRKEKKGKTKEKTKEKKEKKREKKGGGVHGSKGEGEREVTAARERRGKSP